MRFAELSDLSRRARANPNGLQALKRKVPARLVADRLAWAGRQSKMLGALFSVRPGLVGITGAPHALIQARHRRGTRRRGTAHYPGANQKAMKPGEDTISGFTAGRMTLMVG